MPNKPKTPSRNVRVESPLWEAAKRKAAENGEAVADVIRRALEDYVTH
jgi:predicted DNA binding CopG/RHH family protein